MKSYTAISLPAIERDGDPANEHDHEHEAAWQLIRDDPFDHVDTDEQLEDLVQSYAARSSKPYAEVVGRMLGMDGLSEQAARALFERIVEHRREMSEALKRPVRMRVAALDMMTTEKLPVPRTEGRAILVSPALLEKALEEASADAVTGLPQRAHFVSLLRHELRQRKRRSVVVVYMDLDRFKEVNDAYGHARGDEVLRTLARCGRLTLRHGDVFARIGGDEFALLLVDVSVAEARAAIGRLRERFEAFTAPLGVSFSAGIAMAGEDESAESLLARADEAMYRDKRGRSSRPPR